MWPASCRWSCQFLLALACRQYLVSFFHMEGCLNDLELPINKIFLWACKLRSVFSWIFFFVRCWNHEAVMFEISTVSHVLTFGAENKQNNVKTLTNSVFFLLFFLFVGLIWFCFKGHSFPCRSGTAFLGFLLISLVLQNFCKMLHRKLNQVWWPVAKHLHCISLQQLFQTSRYFNSTHHEGQRSKVRLWKFTTKPNLKKNIRSLDLKYQISASACPTDLMNIVLSGPSSQEQPDSSSSRSTLCNIQQLIDFFI